MTMPNDYNHQRRRMAGTTTAAVAQSVFTVRDAKRIITETYPKLFGRFNYAFHGHEDGAPLSEVVDVITANVRTWLESMPDNFKTSNHALSRPKYGIVFALKHVDVRAALGDEYCSAAAETIEKNWDECKKDIVVSKDDAVTLESDDELRARVEDLTSKNEMLSSALVALIGKHYDTELVGLFKTLLNRI
jgi:hypothetical protein